MFYGALGDRLVPRVAAWETISEVPRQRISAKKAGKEMQGAGQRIINMDVPF